MIRPNPRIWAVGAAAAVLAAGLGVLVPAWGQTTTPGTASGTGTVAADGMAGMPMGSAGSRWVFPAMPKTPPLPNATFGSFPAACHYADGTFVPDASQNTCAKTAPGSGAAFTFWHPDLFTMHVWVWYPNPDGLYASMNPLVTPVNAG